MNNLKITNIQLFPVDKETTLKAIVQITFNDALKISGLKLFDGQDGMYLRYPINPKSLKRMCFSFPIDYDFRKQIESDVIDEYVRENS